MLAAEFETKFQSFVEGCREIVRNNHAVSCPNLRPSWFEIRRGSRYIGIYELNDWNKEACIANGMSPEKGVSSRIHVFVDKTNGNVLKAASYKKPETKHPRGNIFDASNGLAYITPYGAMYLDQIQVKEQNKS